MAEIVAVGEILVEMVATALDQGFAAAGTFAGPYPSGAPAIFIDQAARMGASTAIIGCVGTDGFGECVLSRLQQDGVDIAAVSRLGDVATGVAFVGYRRDGSRSYIFHMANAAAGRLSADDLDPATFRDCRILHVMGSSLFSPRMGEAIHRAVRLALDAGARISFDPNVRQELLGLPGTAELIAELAGLAHILLPSEADLAHLRPGLAMDEAARQLLLGPAECVFLKCGAAGSVYYDHARRIATPAFPVSEVDPTGAGDCAGGTFIAGLLLGLPIEETLRRANAAGALAVCKRGPMEGNSSEAELAAFLRNAA
jgi:fructokinase